MVLNRKWCIGVTLGEAKQGKKIEFRLGGSNTKNMHSHACSNTLPSSLCTSNSISPFRTDSMCNTQNMHSHACPQPDPCTPLHFYTSPLHSHLFHVQSVHFHTQFQIILTVSDCPLPCGRLCTCILD